MRDTFFFYTHMALGSFPRVKRSEHGADYPLPSSAVLWIRWSYNFASPLCLYRHVMGWTFCVLEQIHTSNKTLRTVLEFVMLSMRLLNIWIMIQENHITCLFFFIWQEWWVAFQTSGSVSTEFRIVSLRIDYSDPEFPCWLFVIISPMFKIRIKFVFWSLLREYFYPVLQNVCTKLAVKFVTPFELITTNHCEVHIFCIWSIALEWSKYNR
jgi:hypothetical protein